MGLRVRLHWGGGGGALNGSDPSPLPASQTAQDRRSLNPEGDWMMDIVAILLYAAATVLGVELLGAILSR